MLKSKLIIAIAILILAGCQSNPDYLNVDLPVNVRVDDLVSRMTVEEKISQMSHLAPAIERLNVRSYEPNFGNPLGQGFEFDEEEEIELREQRSWENWEYWEEGCLDGGWWNEALHGVARAGLATSFPQSIGMGSTWNPELMKKTTVISSTEARVHYNLYGKKLSYWSPTINILRDPRWGRNEESFSEDPYLLSRMASAFVSGFQGDDEKYLKAIATIKHYVANNSEYNRHDGSSDINERWLREYYMPAFQAAIEESNAFSVMSAYNAVNGVPVSADKRLMTTVLRDEWGFEGYVVSDCGAVSDVVHAHKYETDPEKAVALIVKAGLDLECETCETEQFLFDRYLLNAYNKGYINEDEIDIAVKRLFTARMKLGEFDPKEMVPYSTLSREDLDTDEAREVALQAARESIVLLKNEKNTLPLSKDKIKKLAVIGPNANIVELGGYSGSPSVSIDPLSGIKQLVGSDVDVRFAPGCLISSFSYDDDEEEGGKVEEVDENALIKEAAELAAGVDVAVLVLGTNLSIANETADREDLSLPGRQLDLAKAVVAANPKTIVVLVNGMPLTINWLDENAPAIVEAWYAGQAQGQAIAEVLFGDYNPGGKLPVTFHKSTEDLPALGDYDITKGRTYWFYENDVLYPFGHGLSYTSFDVSLDELESSKLGVGDELTVNAKVTNTGSLKGDEVVQLYVKNTSSALVQPIHKLRKFERVTLDAGASKTLSFKLNKNDFSHWDSKASKWVVEKGEFEIQIGNSSRKIFAAATIEVN